MTIIIDYGATQDDCGDVGLISNACIYFVSVKWCDVKSVIAESTKGYMERQITRLITDNDRTVRTRSLHGPDVSDPGQGRPGPEEKFDPSPALPATK